MLGIWVKFGGCPEFQRVVRPSSIMTLRNYSIDGFTHRPIGLEGWIPFACVVA